MQDDIADLIRCLDFVCPQNKRAELEEMSARLREKYAAGLAVSPADRAERADAAVGRLR